MGIPEKIKKIEDEISRTQVNKATERHLGVLKARRARLQDELEAKSLRKSGGSREGYTVRKDGDATIVLLGLPSVGKSTLLNHLTNSNSKVGAYDFTKGWGRGKRILSTTRNADLLLLITDVFNPNIRDVLLDEIRAIGVRPDEKVPNIRIRKRGSGGVIITDLVGMTRMDVDGIKEILREYRYHNARVVVREDASYDQLIDVLLRNRTYVPTLTVLNKVDMVEDAEVSKIREECDFDFLPISADNDYNLELLKDWIFEKLDLIKLYMKPRGEAPDFEEPLIIRKGSTISDVTDKIHRGLKDELRYTRIWGRSVKHGGQKVRLSHRPMDEDIITFFT